MSLLPQLLQTAETLYSMPVPACSAVAHSPEGSDFKFRCSAQSDCVQPRCALF